MIEGLAVDTGGLSNPVPHRSLSLPLQHVCVMIITKCIPIPVQYLGLRSVPVPPVSPVQAGRALLSDLCNLGTHKTLIGARVEKTKKKKQEEEDEHVSRISTNASVSPLKPGVKVSVTFPP